MKLEGDIESLPEALAGEVSVFLASSSSSSAAAAAAAASSVGLAFLFWLPTGLHVDVVCMYFCGVHASHVQHV